MVFWRNGKNKTVESSILKLCKKKENPNQRSHRSKYILKGNNIQPIFISLISHQ